MLIATARLNKRLVNASLVNCTPWSLLKIYGCDCANASSRASKQKALSSRFDSLQESTYRLYQSKIAAR
jgi:hypothetical protein